MIVNRGASPSFEVRDAPLLYQVLRLPVSAVIERPYYLTYLFLSMYTLTFDQ